MNNVIGAPAPAWLRIVAALGLIWNLIGVYAYLQTVGVLGGGDPSMSAGAMPPWVTGAFAIAVFGGALGCVVLLLLKRLATWLLLLSLLAVLAQDLWAYVLRTGGTAENPVLPLLVNVIAILLVWLAYHADKKGWLS
ncbi:MAG TPA: hypothetical protein VK614_01405 [Allosphingosinicella sp.]|nr:hypothetical protein [Allosphingosinicella sp.]